MSILSPSYIFVCAFAVYAIYKITKKKKLIEADKKLIEAEKKLIELDKKLIEIDNQLQQKRQYIKNLLSNVTLANVVTFSDEEMICYSDNCKLYNVPVASSASSTA